MHARSASIPPHPLLRPHLRPKRLVLLVEQPELLLQLCQLVLLLLRNLGLQCLGSGATRILQDDEALLQLLARLAQLRSRGWGLGRSWGNHTQDERPTHTHIRTRTNISTSARDADCEYINRDRHGSPARSCACEEQKRKGTEQGRTRPTAPPPPH